MALLDHANLSRLSQRQFLITYLFFIIINLLNTAADALSLKQLNNL